MQSVNAHEYPPRHRFAAGAWTARRPCYGNLAVALDPSQRAPQPPFPSLSQTQMDALAILVRSVYQGTQITLENCIRYFGPTSRACDLFRSTPVGR